MSVVNALKNFAKGIYKTYIPKSIELFDGLIPSYRRFAPATLLFFYLTLVSCGGGGGGGGVNGNGNGINQNPIITTITLKDSDGNPKTQFKRLDDIDYALTGFDPDNDPIISHNGRVVDGLDNLVIDWFTQDGLSGILPVIGTPGMYRVQFKIYDDHNNDGNPDAESEVSEKVPFFIHSCDYDWCVGEYNSQQLNDINSIPITDNQISYFKDPKYIGKLLSNISHVEVLGDPAYEDDPTYEGDPDYAGKESFLVGLIIARRLSLEKRIIEYLLENFNTNASDTNTIVGYSDTDGNESVDRFVQIEYSEGTYNELKALLTDPVTEISPEGTKGVEDYALMSKPKGANPSYNEFYLADIENPGEFFYVKPDIRFDYLVNENYISVGFLFNPEQHGISIDTINRINSQYTQMGYRLIYFNTDSQNPYTDLGTGTNLNALQIIHHIEENYKIVESYIQQFQQRLMKKNIMEQLHILNQNL